MNINPLKNEPVNKLNDSMKFELNEKNVNSGRKVKPDKKERNSNNPRKFSLPQLIVIILMLAAIGIAGYLYIQNTQLKSKIDNPAQTLDEQSKLIKTNVSKLIDLYDDSEISVASITNIDNLKTENPDFYKNAKNGDFVLVSKKRAILYSKDRNLILNIAPIVDNTQTIQPTTAPVQLPTNTPAPTSTPVETTKPVKR